LRLRDQCAAANAAQCGNGPAGFPAWVPQFKQEAVGRGVSRSVLDRAFADVHYNQPTIRADRGQKSFKLSFDEFIRTLFTIGNDNTLPIQIWSMLGSMVSPELNAIATLIVALSIGLVVLGELLRGSNR